jgi:hypothetical protein
MTNAQVAHKMGLDKVAHAGWEYKEMLMRSGLTITREGFGICGGVNACEAKVWTQSGWLRVWCGENGTARIDKPNGTHKWVYEKTPAQIAAQLKQIMAFYRL